MGSIGEEVLINHPYNPTDMKLPGFVPIHLSSSAIAGPYLIASFSVVLIVWIASGYIKKITKLERTLMCWWIFTGLTHIVLEGYLLISPEFYKDKTHFYLAELWKEYSKGDSRYVRGDSIIVAIEGMMVAFVGFPALLAFYAIGTKKSYRHLLQLVLSVVQLYSIIINYVTGVLDGDNFATSPYYYYWYYLFANSFWAVIPTVIIIYFWKKMDQEQQKVKRH